MFSGFRGFLSEDLSIDLGTANTLIYLKGQGVILNEPSIVAIQHNRGTEGYKEIIAVGTEAKEMLGRTPANIQTIRPLRDGVIADFNATEKMLQYFIKKAHKNKFFRPTPRVLICVPCGATQVERRAIKESVLGAGAGEVFLIDEPLAAAIGAGMPIDDAKGSMIIDVGGGTTEIAIISLGGIIYSSSIRMGGDKFDESIINYVKRNYGILIGEATAEKIKQQIGCAFLRPMVYELEVRGRSLSSGIPRSFTLNSKDVLEALEDSLLGIVREIKMALEAIPPELAADLLNSGLILTGGGALLRDLDTLITKQIGLSVIIDDEPLTCVVRGCGKVLEMIDVRIKDNIVSFE